MEGGEVRLTVVDINEQNQSRFGFRDEIGSNEGGTESNR